MASSRPKLPKEKLASSLACFLPALKDTFLIDEDMNKLLARFSKPNPGSITKKVVNSGLLQAASFPELVLCPELVLECRNRYDVTQRCIRTYLGEVLVYINRVTIMGALRILPPEVYEAWTISLSDTKFSVDPNTFNNAIAKNWLLTPKKGISRFPHPLTRDHMIPEIKDVITLLNKVKGNQHAFYWENWMYFFIQTILSDKNKHINWAEIIADRLHEELSQSSGVFGFYMSSYLFYVLVCCKEWVGLPHTNWVNSMSIYEYFPCLQKEKNREEFKRVQDTFLAKLVF